MSDSTSSHGPDGRPVYTRRDSSSYGSSGQQMHISNGKQQFVPPNLRARGYSLSTNNAPPSNGMHGVQTAGTGSVLDNVEGSSTSASLNSPTVYASRSSAKRFGSGTLYGEETVEHPYNSMESQYAQYPETTSTSYGSAGGPGISSRSAYPHNGLANGRYEKEDKPRRKQSWTNPLARPPQGLLGRRKRSETPKPSIRDTGSRRSLDYRNALYKPQTLALVTILVILAYTLLPAPSISVERGPLDELRTTRSNRYIEQVQLPRGKWWQTEEDSVLNTAQPKKRRRQTSFVTPRHTYEELLELPPRSEYRTSKQQDTLSITAFVDCTTSQPDPFASHNLVSLNDLLRSLHEQSRPPHAIEVLVSSANYPKSDPGLFSPQKDWISVRSLSPSQDPLVGNIFRNTASSFVLILDCPASNPPGGIPSTAGTSASSLETLLRVATSEVYSGHILSTAGFPPRLPGPLQSGKGPLARSADIIRQTPSSCTRPLVETMLLDIPAGPALFDSSWLRSLSTESTLIRLPIEAGLVARLGVMLRHSQGIETWGLPVPRLFGGTSEEHLLSLSKILNQPALQQILHPNSMSTTSSGEVQTSQGSPAKVAIFLADEDAADPDWEHLICGFANEQRFGHVVQIFLPATSRSAHAGGMLGRCPNIIYRRLDPRHIEDFQPDICLTSQAAESQVTGKCTRIQLPTEQVRHVDWLPTLPLESLQSWNIPKIDLVVITNNRPLSLHRLATSLRQAHYLSDAVNLFVNMEQTADAATSAVLQDSVWPFGQLILRHRVVLGGLLPAIVESWYPANNDTYGVLLEDDVEVSPLFYVWLRYNILKYRYGPPPLREQSKRLFGISLYQPKNIELRPEGRRSFNAHQLFQDLDIPPSMPYLSQIPCSWGAAYFPEHWREFHQFLALRLSESSLDLAEVIVPDIRSNRWPKSWKRYIIELIYLRGYTMLYPNFEDFRSLSTNHLELGTHVKDDAAAQKRREAFEVPLLTEEDSLLEGMPGYRLPDWSALPVLDLWGSITTESEIVGRAQITIEELDLCPSTAEADATLPDSPVTFNATELLCPREEDDDDYATSRVSLLERESLLARREARVAEREAAVSGGRAARRHQRLDISRDEDEEDSVPAPMAMMPDASWLDRIADTLQRQQQRLEADRMSIGREWRV